MSNALPVEDLEKGVATSLGTVENDLRKELGRPPSSIPATSAGYSITIDFQVLNVPGALVKVLAQIAQLGGSLSEVVLLSSNTHYTGRRITVKCHDERHSEEIAESLKGLTGVHIQGCVDDTFRVHEGGKLSVTPKSIARDSDELARVYTPGVARVCSAIAKNKNLAKRYTIKGNSVAIVTDGSAVLGLGNIGPEAAMPVMEGKAALFKQFAGIDAYPICLSTQDPDEIIKTVKYLSPGFGGINLEDISAPRCFEIEQRLKEELDIPVFHDDQHGTAVVVLAGLINSLKIVGKQKEGLKVVINGFGAGGLAVARTLLHVGIKNVIGCDRAGAIYQGRTVNMNPIKEMLSRETNPNREQGSLPKVIQGADIFIGLSEPGMLTPSMVRTMAKDSIVFALANPTPEVMPEEISGVARIIATGRSDYPNQVNNCLCFPGIFRGALNSGARQFTWEMKIAAAEAIAEAVPVNDLSEEKIIPSVFDEGISEMVATKVQEVSSKVAP